jgi:hypothetical protein
MFDDDRLAYMRGRPGPHDRGYGDSAVGCLNGDGFTFVHDEGCTEKVACEDLAGGGSRRHSFEAG